MSDQVTQAPQAPAASAPTAPAAPATAPAAPQISQTDQGTKPAAQASAAGAEASPAKEPVAKPTSTVLGAEPPKTDAKTDAKAPASPTEKPTDTKAVDPAKVDAKTDAAKDPAKTDAKPVEGEQKKEGSQSDEPAPLPTYESFKLPDGVSADDIKLGEFTGLLAEIELAKGDHTKMQEYGQKLVDRHIAEVQASLQRQNEFYLNAFEKQKSEWKDAFVKDPEIGGNRQETTVAAALEFIRTHGGNEQQQAELRQLMEQTGVGNHPAMIRIFAKAMTNMREGKPLPAPKPEAKSMSKVEKRYGKTT